MRLFSVALACAAATAVHAGNIFYDDFDSENGGVANSSTLNYDNFTNWDVSDGTVDLIGNGYFDFLPGNGLYVDLDGSTGNAGIFSTKTLFTFEAGTQYELSFLLAGNQRNTGDEEVTINIGLAGLLSETITIAQDAAFTTYTYTFVGDGTTAALIFENMSTDNRGALLDQVQLSVIPLPHPAALASAGFFGLVAARRRR